MKLRSLPPRQRLWVVEGTLVAAAVAVLLVVRACF